MSVQLSAALMFVAAVLVGGGCDRDGRHRVLSFFFDGVPDPNAPATVAAEGEEDAAAAGGAAAAVAMISHEPIAECGNCHGADVQSGSSGLRAEEPELCYECHESLVEEAVVHGPVAVGTCLFCHEPHKSRNPGLLTARVPELCYRCHDEEVVATIEAHQMMPYESCVRCHEPHSGPNRHLLKFDPQHVAGSAR